MDNRPDSYSSLYSGEAPAGGQTGTAAEYAAQINPEQAALINKGRTKAKVIGVLFVGMAVLSSLGDFFDFSQGIAYWAGARLANVLFIAGGVLFIKGNNAARIVLGVCGIFVWFTLFDKSVKAYCKQSKNT